MSDTSQKRPFVSLKDEGDEASEGEQNSGNTPSTQNMSPIDFAFCQKTLKEIKKSKHAFPFLEPVDPVKFNIPNYVDVIKNPMDLSTIESKLNDHQYLSIHAFESDFKLMFDNCYLFNHKQDPVSKEARELQRSFLKKMKKAPTVYSMPAADLDIVTLDENHTDPVRTGDGSSVYIMADDEYRRCENAVKELRKPKYSAMNWPFLEPVDDKAWGDSACDYYQVITNPMDISTFARKLTYSQYKDELDFEKDVRLMFQNCYRYNPDPNHPVHKLGKELEAVFDSFWEKSHEKTTGKAGKRKPVSKAPKDDLKDAPYLPSSLGKHSRDTSDPSTEPKERSTKIRIKPPSGPSTAAKTPDLALSQNPPPQTANRPKLALTPSSAPVIDRKKTGDKWPPVILQNQDKWRAIGQKALPSSSNPGTGTATPESTLPPTQPVKPPAIVELYEKMQEEQRRNDEQKRREEAIRKEELLRMKRLEEERRRELQAKQASDKAAHLEELNRGSIDINRQRAHFQQFEQKLKKNDDWIEIFHHQKETVEYRHLPVVPGFARRSTKSLDEVRSMLLSAQGRLQRKGSDDQGEADMDIE